MGDEHGERFHQDSYQWRRDIKGNGTVYARRLLLDFGKGALTMESREAQNEKKRKEKKKRKQAKNVILFALNNERT